MSGAEDVKITVKKPIRPDTKDATAAAKKLIRSNAVSKEINPEKQNRHVRDSGEYIPGRSYIFGDVQTAQHLVDQYHGTGVPIISNSGRWMKREVVSTDADIGVNVNKHTGEETRTNKFTIHYSNTGTHIVPTIREV